LEDCVCRAISTVTSIDYEETMQLLENTAKAYNCEKLCVCCYHYLIEDYFGYACNYCDNGEVVQDIANLYPNDKIIIRVKGHLTCSINGKIKDIWDCSQEKVDCYWVKNNKK
jgi:hypothetical protein